MPAAAAPGTQEECAQGPDEGGLLAAVSPAARGRARAAAGAAEPRYPGRAAVPGAGGLAGRAPVL